MQIEYLNDLHMVRYRFAEYEDDFAVLTADYAVRAGGVLLTAPNGMRFGPSIPKRARSFVSVGDCLEGSAIHDLLYRAGIGPRKWADQVFAQMTADMSGGWNASKAYWALRVLGERTLDASLQNLLTERDLWPTSGIPA